MNYLSHYKKLIKKAKIRQNSNLGYIESHHIIPICLGGSNNSYNLVNLTAREHFIAHVLLAKISKQIYGEKHNNYIKMIYAARQFLYRKATKTANYKITARMYANLRNAYSLHCNKSKEFRDKISKANKIRFVDKKNHPMFGKKQSVDAKKKMSAAHMGVSPWNKGIKTGPQEEKTILKRANSNKHVRGKYKLSNKNKYKYELTRIDGTVIEFTGLLLFCRNNPQYNATSIGRVVNGRQKTHKDILNIRKIGEK